MVRHESATAAAQLRLYFAAPLFSLAERRFNEMVVARLEKDFAVFLPQRDGQLFVELIANGISPEDAAEHVFEKDVAAIRDCDVFLAILDGRTIDEGVALELGMAFSLNKNCVGLQTDCRRLLPTGNNPMVTCALHETFLSLDHLLAWLSAHAARSAKPVKC